MAPRWLKADNAEPPLYRHPLPLGELFPVRRSAAAGAVARRADATERIEDLVVDGLVVDVEQPEAQLLAGELQRLSLGKRMPVGSEDACGKRSLEDVLHIGRRRRIECQSGLTGFGAVAGIASTKAPKSLGP